MHTTEPGNMISGTVPLISFATPKSKPEFKPHRPTALAKKLRDLRIY